MKEFLIFKKPSGCERHLVNATLKILSSDNNSNLYGEIYVINTQKAGFSCHLLTTKKHYFASCNGGLKFVFSIPESEILKGFTAVITEENSKSPLLYLTYKQGEEDLQKVVSLSPDYNDEEIAVTNYYEGENYETERVYFNDNDRDFEDKKSPPKDQAGGETLLYEKLSQNFKGERFYEQIKQQFNQIIYCHEKDRELCLIIPNSEFVKINYDSDRFYSVGRITENGSVKYLCYAVKGNYMQAPAELKPYCRFLPLSPFNPLSEGYYVIFQSAEDGKIV
ncbi:MAG: hypothetical protein J6V66_07585 [Clostridia bacterium]|nr:hypothetical protein [Clostridia bacterium]